ncbi:hypothetical protein THASP1DRAFT_32333 [Thamnocephalis sphaerospora]|uniref:Uncharacterized protein n=1 Tax=Thamnocephalis sphaerospora TaxID=78915 RepID=A0A4P9XJC4_9FUNG|nr:hypothetical protein THASP1DRAFT_32333 [Thamnocephalis sphaerospora]|eukprot:RKP05838.1 hypothetical protein THASP1DRAFT_32333 [Thamnocephalis sphaerospora]
MSQPLPPLPAASSEGDNIPLLKRKRLSVGGMSQQTPPPAESPSNELPPYMRHRQSSSASSTSSFKGATPDDEDIPLRERSPSGASRGHVKGRMSVSDMLSDEARPREESGASINPTPPRTNSRTNSPDSLNPAMEGVVTVNAEMAQQMPHAKRPRLPSLPHPLAGSSAPTPLGPAGANTTASPLHRAVHAHAPPPSSLPSGHGHPQHMHAHAPPPPHVAAHPHPHPHQHPHQQPQHLHPHAHPHQGPHYPPHPHHAPPTTPVTVLHASQGHSAVSYAAPSPQHPTFRHGPPSGSGLSNRNRLNLTVHAPSYNEGHTVMVSPRHPVGGELMGVPTTVASAGPATTTYAAAGMRSAVVALRTAAGPLPPKAKLTPRTPVGPEASRYRRPPASATIPSTEVTILASSAVTSPRTEVHPRQRSTDATPLPLHQVSGTPATVVSSVPRHSAPNRSHGDEELSRRQFMTMFETLYDRAFGVQQPVTPPSAPTPASASTNGDLGATQQKRLHEIASAVEGAGGLEALIRDRVQEALAAAGLDALTERVRRLEAQSGLDKSSPEMTMEKSKVDVDMVPVESVNLVKSLSERVELLEQQQQQQPAPQCTESSSSAPETVTADAMEQQKEAVPCAER